MVFINSKLRIFMKKFLFILVLSLVFSSTYAQKTIDKPSSDWKFTGLAQVISQMDGKDFSDDTHPLFYNIMKFRVGAEKTLFDKIDFKLELQDSRIMGSEAGATNNLHNLDLFQGYISIKDIANTPLSLQIGRFQMQYGSERVIGRSFWHMNERVFDGFRLKYHTKNFKADFFNIIHTNSTDYVLKIFPRGLYSYPAETAYGYGVYGLWTQTQLNENNKLDVFGIMEADEHKNTAENIDMTRNTIGFNYFGNFGPLSAVVEFAFQVGSKKGDTYVNDTTTSYDKDINAYMANFKLDYKMKPAKITLGYNMISGTDPNDDKEINTYSNYLASKHKFFGLMDYFLVIGKGTANLGLNDIYLGVSYKDLMKGLSASLTGHYFTSKQTSKTELSDLGQEIDLVFNYKILKGSSIKFGGGLFMPGDLMKEIWTVQDGTKREDMSFWAFAMLATKL